MTSLVSTLSLQSPLATLSTLDSWLLKAKKHIGGVGEEGGGASNNNMDNNKVNICQFSTRIAMQSWSEKRNGKNVEWKAVKNRRPEAEPKPEPEPEAEPEAEPKPETIDQCPGMCYVLNASTI